MGNLTKNKLIDSLLKTMLFFAVVHMILLFILTITQKSLLPLNVFQILGLDAFNAPSWLFTSPQGTVLSLLCMLIVYCIIYRYFHSK